MSLDRISHYPVMLEEVISLIKKPNIIVDSTFGGGGYSKDFLKNLSIDKELTLFFCTIFWIDIFFLFKKKIKRFN